MIPKQQQQAAASTGVGLGQDSFVEGGGLWDDFDGTILEAGFVQWDYQGKVDPPVLALALEIQNDDEEVSAEGGNPNPFVQYYSAGDLTSFVPSDDGLRAIPVGSKTGISKSTNMYALIMSIIAAGFDKPFGNSVDILFGARFHFKRQEQAERKGLKKEAREDGRKPQILLAETYLGMKGGPAAGAGAKAKPGAAPPAAGPGPKPPTATAGPKPVPPKPPAAPTAAKPPAATNGAAMPDEETQVWAGAYILSVLEANSGSHPKIGLSKGVIAWAKENSVDPAARNKIIQALGNEAFLNQAGLGWTFDGSTLTAE